MAYCTPDDIRKILPEDILVQLTDDDNQGVVDEEKLVEALSDGECEVNGYASSRYTTPFDPVPQIIRKLTLDVGIYNLFSRRENVPENRKERYGNAVKMLNQLAAGKLTIGEVEKPAVQTGNTIKMTSKAKLFDEATLNTF